MVTRLISECIPQLEDVLGQITFLDKGLRPDRLEQLFLKGDSSGVFQQVLEDLKFVWCECAPSVAGDSTARLSPTAFTRWHLE